MWLQDLLQSYSNTVWHGWKNRKIDRWNIVESPKKDSHKCSQLICDKGAKAIQWGKIVFSTNDGGIIGHLHAKKKKKNLDTDISQNLIQNGSQT